MPYVGIYNNVKDILSQVKCRTPIHITFQMWKFISFFLSPEGLLPEPSAFLSQLDLFPSRLKLAPQAFFQHHSVLEPMSPRLFSHDLAGVPRFAGTHHEKDTGVVEIRILELSLIFISWQDAKYFRNHFQDFIDGVSLRLAYCMFPTSSCVTFSLESVRMFSCWVGS